ncbi:MAG: hypothetical protein WAU88_08300 [Candidatus Zixiibacteriota bacterium]
MSLPLETRINPSCVFRSAGERKIADVLSKYGIPYKYESPTLVQDEQQKPRIWYPDFYLPTLGVYVEFYGLSGTPDYDNLRSRKLQAYQKTGLEVISVDGSKPLREFEGYLLNQLYRVQHKRFQGIRSHIYRLRSSTGQWYR